MNRSYFFPEQLPGLGITLLNCGHETRTQPSYRLDGMQRGSTPIVIWQYTLHGCGAIDIGGARHDLPPGTGFLVTVPGKHVYYLPAGAPPWEFVYFTLEGPVAATLAAEIIARHGNILASSTASPASELLFARLNAPADESCSQFELAVCAYRFLVSLYEEQERAPLQSPGRRLLQRVNDHLARNIAATFTVEQLAAAAGLSRSHFARLFHEAAGVTAQYYLGAARLRLAVRLLQTGELSIKETAERCGFADANYFCRAFRRNYGISPGRFRRMSGTTTRE